MNCNSYRKSNIALSIKKSIDTLTVFNSIKNVPAISSLRSFADKPTSAGYCNFVSAFYPCGADFALYVRSLVLDDDNFYVKSIASGETPDTEIKDSVDRELTSLEYIASLKPDDLSSLIADTREFADAPSGLPAWHYSDINLKSDFDAKLENIQRTGFGIFAKHIFFRFTDAGITPVAHPDFQQLDQLYGYERQRRLIIRNTEALIDNKVANNMLLYGDMGTGKSSSIKAVAAHFANCGLRLVEIKKEQLLRINEIMDELASNPLKFIIFIDDLSFTGNDNSFSSLKAALEGGVCGCGTNTVIYATSNRRHLLRESAADRHNNMADDDLHLNDTLQETMSLSARFGLTVTFGKPDRDEYLSIVMSLADEYGILDEFNQEELFTKAEAFAIRKNGRSPRTARQFIELLKIGI